MTTEAGRSFFRRPCSLGLSLVITAYDRAAGLDQTLSDVAQQTLPPDEVIVADDASPGDLAPVVAKWAGRVPGLVHRRQPHNLGMPGNLNDAWAETRGALIANWHDGDRYPPGLLAAWVAALEAHPEATFAFSPVSVGGRPQPFPAVPPYSPAPTFYERWQEGRWRGSSLVWGTVLGRRSAYERTLPLDPDYGAIADVDLWMRLARTGGVCCVAEPRIDLDPHSRFTRRVHWPRARALERMHRRHRRAQAAARGRRVSLAGWARHGLVFGWFFLLQAQSALRRGR